MTRAADWGNKHGKLPLGRGVGLACSSYLSGAGLPIYWNDMPHSGVQLKLDRSGGVTVFCGATEIGQGSDDVLVGCVAEVLGIEPLDIRAVTGDTDLTPVDLGSYSSRVTLMMGNAAIQAAERARDLLADAVSKKLGVPKDRLVFADGRVFDAENPGAGVSFAEAVCLAEAMFGTIGTTGSYTPPRSAAKFKGGGVGPSPTYSYSAAIVEVEVDASTGWVHVPRVWIAHDIGRSLNPTLVRGQVEGSVYMALGEALMEEQTFRRLPPRLSHALVHKFPSMLEYKSPTTLDMPEVFTELVENPDPRGPFGAKEVGQGPLLPVMPAVANAVYDAIGVRIDEVPITPEKILKALDAKAAGKAPRYGPARFPDIAWPDAAARPAAVGRRRRQGRRQAATRQNVKRQTQNVSQPTAVTAHDAAAALHLSRTARRARGRGPARVRAAPVGDARRGRHRSAAEHEAPAAGAVDADRPAPGRGASRDIANGQRADHRRRRHVDRARARYPRAMHVQSARIEARTRACGRRPRRSRRRTCATWARSAATSASIRAATTTTRTTSGGRRSTSA